MLFIEFDIEIYDDLKPDDVVEGMVSVVSVKLPDAQFESQTKAKLGNSIVRTIVYNIVKEKLSLVGLSGIEKNFPNELSGGMQKRVSFARAIVTNPELILYDEPTSGLDPVTSTVIENYINTLRKELGATSIVVTHQMSTIRRTSDKVLMLYNGKVVFEGTPDELCLENTEYTKQFVNATLEGPMKMNYEHEVI